MSAGVSDQVISTYHLTVYSEITGKIIKKFDVVVYKQFLYFFTYIPVMFQRMKGQGNQGMY